MTAGAPTLHILSEQVARRARWIRDRLAAVLTRVVLWNSPPRMAARWASPGPQPGTWIEEVGGLRRRLLVVRVRTMPALPQPVVELRVDGRPAHPLTLSTHAVLNPLRFRQVPPETGAD